VARSSLAPYNCSSNFLTFVMSRVALKVVESAPFFRKSVNLWPDGGTRDYHSLHYSVSLPESLIPDLPFYFINKYSKKGDRVLDPFSGVGTTAFQAALCGRIPCAADVNPLCVNLTRAKLSPADIAEVTLFSQKVDYNRPVELSNYRKYFAPFYDPATFRDLVNLRAELARSRGRVASFVELMVLSLLHGHSAGFLSAYTFPQVSLTPEEQLELNNKRRQVPDYRAVAPRILKRCASSLRDGIPSILESVSKDSWIAQAEASKLRGLQAGSIDLVVTSPPLPGSSDNLSHMWLKFWFAGIETRSFADRVFRSTTVPDWSAYMEEVLKELGRVVRVGGRCVLDLKEVSLRRGVVYLDEVISSLIKDKLSSVWEPECCFIQEKNKVALKGSISTARAQSGNRLLVLRRR